MSYYKVLGLQKEPFSTSPDPDFLYMSRERDVALTNILIELYLKRGLSVVLGDIGTGKTTLSRKLIRCLQQKGGFVLNIMLDPHYKSERHFLLGLLANFGDEAEKLAGDQPLKQLSAVEMKQILQKYLYEKCVVQKNTVVVIVDEAQKLASASLEMLRVMLNYETNDNKLLQLVLLGQMELQQKICSMPNFLDRISFKYTLQPFSIDQTRDMIDFRLEQAGYAGGRKLFTDEAIEKIQRLSKGYPRKTTLLCHRALKAAVMKNRWAVTQEIIENVIEEEVNSGWLSPTLN